MGLYKRGHIWWMRFTYKGRVIKRSTEVKDRKLAEKIYHKVMSEIAENKWFERLPGEKKTFRELMEKYLIEYSTRNKAPSTHRRDKSLAAHLLNTFGNLTLSEITPKQIAEYKTRRRKEGAAPKTVNDELKLMGHAFNLAIKEWEWVKENPVSRVSKERVNNQRDRWLTYEEEQRLLENSPEWLRQIIIFALNTGFRRSEIINLQWQQVDLFRKTITLLEQKNRSKDTLPFNAKVYEVLKERAKLRHIKSSYVFYNANGNRIDGDNLSRVFRNAVKRAGIQNFRFHDLRHTFATRLVQSGVDIYTVQKLGRWKCISMVQRYAHHYPESLRYGVEVLEKNTGTILEQSNNAGDNEGSIQTR